MFFRRKAISEPDSSNESSSAEAYLYIKQKGERRWYRISDQGHLSMIKDAPAKCRLVFTFDEDEVRLPVAKKMTYHEAYRALRQDKGMQASLINQSRTLGTVYGIEETVSQLFPGTAVPILFAVDKIMRERGLPSRGPAMALVLFGDKATAPRSALVVGYNEDNTIAAGNLTQNIADVHPAVTNAIRVMANNNSLKGLPYNPSTANADEKNKAAEAAFFASSLSEISFPDLLQAALRETGYPRQPVFRGVSVKTLGMLAISVSAIAAGSAWAGVFAIEHREKNVKAQANALATTTFANRAVVRQQLLDRIEGLGTKLTLQPALLFASADSVWQPGSKVQLNATLNQAQMTLVVPNTRTNIAPGVDRRLAAIARGDDSIIRSLRTKPPTGWTINGIETVGDLNAFNVAYSNVPVDVGFLDFVGLGATASQASIPTTPVGKPASNFSPSPIRSK